MLKGQIQAMNISLVWLITYQYVFFMLNFKKYVTRSNFKLVYILNCCNIKHLTKLEYDIVTNISKMDKFLFFIHEKFKASDISI